jgi:hypothetical protein
MLNSASILMIVSFGLTLVILAGALLTSLLFWLSTATTVSARERMCRC